MLFLKTKLNIQRQLNFLVMAHKTQFKNVPERPHFAQEEENVYAHWNKIDAFQKQLEITKHHKPYTFYDGPPFATGLPHYGHICAGTIKDVVCRYFAQTGHYVERRFGWDCHGLPVEFEIDKALGIKHKRDVLEMGIAKYNAECRSIVTRYSAEWRTIIGRCGRWIDFDNDYKTLDLKFMESVWWVFKQIWEKGHVYRGCRVMPYSNGCNTVLSNFETQQNYKEVVDPAIYITFPWVKDPDTKFVAWTTTPWTLPSNLALVVHPTFEYVRVFDHEHKTHFVIAEQLIGELYPPKGGAKYEIKERFKGVDLVGTEYIPLFPYFESRRADGCFRVIADTYVTNDTGTGIVHCAPGFGADDYRVAVKASIIQSADPPVPIDENGRFKELITDFSGMHVKDADKEVRKYLKNTNRLLVDGQIRHNYPFCWRSETPLIYKAVHCWFIKVTDFKDKLVLNNKKSYWVPAFAQEGRFNNWLENAEDWCFSRNRFWGNPIPIWVSEDYEEQVCIGSIEELKQLSGIESITDLHRESIDHITIPSKEGKGVLRRIDEIFDCWFESGAMPYAQQHYPFTMKEDTFQKIFPADFIAEGIDQTRGWFYTLNVLATALRDDTPYKNLIVNGLVLNHEGKKMSKSKRNYPDPMEIINQYGADAMRLYLINSPLVRAENLHFKESGVKDTVRDVFLPWYNAYRFLLQNISRYENETSRQFVWDEQLSNSGALQNLMDKWIIATEQNLIRFVRQEMEKYRLYTVVPELLRFLENLTNWYVRLNRPRFKGENGPEDQFTSLNVLFDVLLKLSILLSPYVPFTTDSFYQNLRQCIRSERYAADSIHFLQIPEFNPALIDEAIELDVTRMQGVINNARKIRETKNISLKQPIISLTIITNNDSLIASVLRLRTYIEEEVNTPQIIIEKDASQFVELKAEPNNQICGKELGERFCKDFITKVRALNQDQIRQFQTDGKLSLSVTIQREKKAKQEEPIQQLQQEEPAQQLLQQQQPSEPAQKGGKKAPKKEAKKREFEEFVEEAVIEARHVTIKEHYKTENLPKYMILSVENEYSLLLDSRQDEKLRIKGLTREFTNRIQKLRKKAKLNVDDQIYVFYKFHENTQELQNAVATELKNIVNQIKKPILPFSQLSKYAINVPQGSNSEKVEEFGFELVLTYATPIFDLQKLEAKYGPKIANLIQTSLSGYLSKDLALKLQDGVLSASFDGQLLALKEGDDFHLHPTL